MVGAESTSGDCRWSKSNSPPVAEPNAVGSRSAEIVLRDGVAGPPRHHRGVAASRSSTARRVLAPRGGQHDRERPSGGRRRRRGERARSGRPAPRGTWSPIPKTAPARPRRRRVQPCSAEVVAAAEVKSRGKRPVGCARPCAETSRSIEPAQASASWSGSPVRVTTMTSIAPVGMVSNSTPARRSETPLPPGWCSAAARGLPYGRAVEVEVVGVDAADCTNRPSDGVARKARVGHRPRASAAFEVGILQDGLGGTGSAPRLAQPAPQPVQRLPDAGGGHHDPADVGRPGRAASASEVRRTGRSKKVKKDGIIRGRRKERGKGEREDAAVEGQGRKWTQMVQDQRKGDGDPRQPVGAGDGRRICGGASAQRRLVGAERFVRSRGLRAQAKLSCRKRTELLRRR